MSVYLIQIYNITTEFLKINASVDKKHIILLSLSIYVFIPKNKKRQAGKIRPPHVNDVITRHREYQ